MIQLVCYCNSTRLYDISRCIRLTKRTRFYYSQPLDAFGSNPQMILTALPIFPLSSLRDDLHHARVSKLLRLWSSMPPSLCKITDWRRIDVSRTRCLTTAMRLSLLWVYFASHVRRSVCDTVVPRKTVRNTAYSNPRGVTRCTTFFISYYFMDLCIIHFVVIK